MRKRRPEGAAHFIRKRLARFTNQLLIGGSKFEPWSANENSRLVRLQLGVPLDLPPDRAVRGTVAANRKLVKSLKESAFM
jgi:hypothetical protein